MKPKSYSVQEVFNYADIGMIFEFYSTKESEFIIDALVKHTGKNIILTNETDHIPTYTNAILLKEYEAKKSRYQLHLAQQNYSSMIPIIREVNKWIAESAETTHDTMLKVSLSFNHRYLDTLQSISVMNPARLVLKLDENFIYERFPEQEFSAYALSIKAMTPIDIYINEEELQQNIKSIINLPQAEFYGVDFTDYTRGILYFNYIGGKKYAERGQAVKETLDYFIIKAYQSINEEDYTPFEIYEMSRITERLDKIQRAYYDPEVFLQEFTSIGVYANLKTSEQTLKTYWSYLRKPLFEMIIRGGLETGQFNYDTETGRIQLRGAKLKSAFMKDIEFFDCELNGVLEHCNFTNCKLYKSRIYKSKFIRGNEIAESYCYHVSVNNSNSISHSYVINEDEVVNCKVIKSVIKFATPGKQMNLDESSTIIIKDSPLPLKSEAVQVDEIRDYTWIKRMNITTEEGYGNEYTKDKYKKLKFKKND